MLRNQTVRMHTYERFRIDSWVECPSIPLRLSFPVTERPPTYTEESIFTPEDRP